MSKDKIIGRPLVVGSLLGQQPLESQIQCAKRARVDVVEVRLDTFPIVASPKNRISFSKLLLSTLRKKFKRPLLLTFRANAEAGPFKKKGKTLSEGERKDLLIALLPFCDFVDVEIRHRALARLVTQAAHQKKVRVIHSLHDFSGMPTVKTLNRYAKVSAHLKGDYFKVAVTAPTEEDVQNFLHWGRGLKKPAPVLIAMGPLGIVTRVLGFSFGSRFTYGHLGHRAAPGQIPARELGRQIREIYRFVKFVIRAPGKPDSTCGLRGAYPVKSLKTGS